MMVVEKLSDYYTYSCQWFSEGILQVLWLFMILRFKWSVKENCVTKILLAICESFSYENDDNFNSYKFRYKLLLYPFCTFVWIKNKSQFLGSFLNFLNVNFIFLFIMSCALLLRHVELNKLLIFLHIILVHF